MKSRFSIILITFAATTAFWCLVLFGCFWLSCPPQEGMDAITQLRKSGYYYLLIEKNREGHSGTLVVDAIQTSAAGAEITKAELFRTNLAPSQTMLLGLRRENTRK